MKIVLLTHPPTIFNLLKIKGIIKNLLRKTRGPNAVLKSLTRGLKEIPVDFELNPNVKKIREADVVHVIEGVGTLCYALNLKKKGQIRKLIAGPNILVNPNSYKGVMLDEAIDRILLPSKWSKEYFVSKCNSIDNKVEIWPSGVHDPYTNETPVKIKKVIIYDKLFNLQLIKEIEFMLSKKGVDYEIIEYGSFKQREFFSKLESSIAMIYLSASESQGLALQEAWIRDVPTYVIKREKWEYQGESWVDEKINAPYLTSHTGAFFDSIENLDMLIDIQLSGKSNFSAREKCLSSFTDRESAIIYYRILQNVLFG